MQQRNIWHIAKYQDNKIHPKFIILIFGNVPDISLLHYSNIKIIKFIRNLCKRPNTANVHFQFPLRNLQPQTCGLIYKFHEEMHGH